MKLTSTAARVPSHTAGRLNERIQYQIEGSVAYFLAHPNEIPRRLAELDREWDIERALETGSSGLTLLGLFLGMIRGRRWLLLSLAVQGFFLQHALQGWCPPLPVLRRLGVRTADEINQERHALLALQKENLRIPPLPRHVRRGEIRAPRRSRMAGPAVRIAMPQSKSGTYANIHRIGELHPRQYS